MKVGEKILDISKMATLYDGKDKLSKKSHVLAYYEKKELKGYIYSRDPSS